MSIKERRLPLILAVFADSDNSLRGTHACKLTQRFFAISVLFSPSYTSKVPEQRLDESNVGHQMLKKMGEKGKKCDLLVSSCHTINSFSNALYIYTEIDLAFPSCYNHFVKFSQF